MVSNALKSSALYFTQCSAYFLLVLSVFMFLNIYFSSRSAPDPQISPAEIFFQIYNHCHIALAAHGGGGGDN
jgi:hypothetical protein